MDLVDDPISKELESFEASLGIIDLLLGHVGRYIEERELQDRVLQTVVTTCVEDALTTVAMAELSREGPAAPGSWSIDEEPASCPCDTWARGSLSMKTRTRAGEKEAAGLCGDMSLHSTSLHTHFDFMLDLSSTLLSDKAPC
jgi:hypothetical protein